MSAYRFRLPWLLVVIGITVPAAADDLAWRAPGFRFARPVRIVAEIPVKETKRPAAETEGVPGQPQPTNGFISALESAVAMAPGTVLGSVTASDGDTLSCVVAAANETPTATLRITIDSRLGMRGYRVNGEKIEFRAGFESRPELDFSGSLPPPCRSRFEQQAEEGLTQLLDDLKRPAGAISMKEFFDKAEAGTPGELPVRVAFLGTAKTVKLTFPMPRPFGQ